jgi:uncharacterized membrane protein YuzA (DUF378 family)
VTVFALAKIDHQYLLYGIAAAICLVIFVTLILSPALSSYGRLWEKTAAGVLSLFVLAALILGGVVIGLVFVFYYPNIVDFLHGNSGRAGATWARVWRRRTLRGAASSPVRIALLFGRPASLPRLVRRSPATHPCHARPPLVANCPG